MNPTDSPVFIRKGTTIGMFEPVDDINENHSQHNEGRNTKELPAQLQMLLDKSSKYLDRTQKYKLKEMLINYQDVFALNDEDMGFTDTIKHQIDTNGSRPVKQRMRRLPHQMAEEADKQVDDI